MNKKIILFFIAVAIPVILLFGYITLPNCVEFVPRQTVTSSFPLSKDFKDALRKGKLTTVNASGFEHWEDYYDRNDAKDIAQYCERVVADELIFSFKKKSERKSNEQNCVGFAAMLTEACNYTFKVNNVDAVCYHVKGSVKYLGIDLCSILGLISPFFKDHDFCVVKYKNETIILDSTLYSFTHL